MVLDDIGIDVGINVDDAGLDALIGKLEALEAIDPVEVDVELNVDDDAIDAVSNGGVDVSVTDGGTDGGSRIDPLGFSDVVNIENELRSQFDPRGLINDELTIEDIISGSDTDIFDIRENQVDNLISSGRPDRGIEKFFDFDQTDFSPSDLFGFQESDPETFAEEMEKVIQTPRDTAFDRRANSGITRFMDHLLGRDKATGEKIPGQGILGRFDNLSMDQFYTAVAQIVPLILTFVGALPAAIAGVVGLGVAAMSAAGALAAVGGLALMGGALALGDGNINEGLKEIQKIVEDDILGAIKPLARRFDDLFFDALNGFEEFMQAIASHGQVLTRLKDDARALGGFILDFVPPALAALVTLGDAFTPIFAMLGDWLASGFDDFLKGLVGATRRALPYILSLVDSFIIMIPVLFDLSMGFLMVATFVIRLIGFVSSFINWLGPLGTMLGLVVGALLSFASAAALVYQVGLLLGPVYTALAGSALVAYISSAWTSMVASYGLAASIVTVTLAAGALLGILTFGIAPILGALSSGFLGLSSNIDTATKSLKGFENTRSGLSGMGDIGGMSGHGGLSRSALTVYENNSTTKVELPPDATTDDAYRLGRRINYGNSQFKNY